MYYYWLNYKYKIVMNGNKNGGRGISARFPGGPSGGVIPVVSHHNLRFVVSPVRIVVYAFS